MSVVWGIHFVITLFYIIRNKMLQFYMHIYMHVFVYFICFIPSAQQFSVSVMPDLLICSFCFSMITASLIKEQEYKIFITAIYLFKDSDWSFQVYFDCF